LPLRADVNYTLQMDRALTFLSITKFGMIALQHALSLLHIKVPQLHRVPNEKFRFLVTHFTYSRMEMVDTFEGGKITVFTQYLLSHNETPFRVVIDPPVGNLNALLAIEINAIVNRLYQSLPDSYHHDQMQPKESQNQLREFWQAYHEKSSLAGQDLSELIGSYLHVKTHFRIVWDLCDQANEFHDAEEAGI